MEIEKKIHLPQGTQQFAEQELVDCSGSDNGCGGGLPSRAYSDMIKHKMGLELESDYPYHALAGQCKADKSKEKVRGRARPRAGRGRVGGSMVPRRSSASQISAAMSSLATVPRWSRLGPPVPGCGGLVCVLQQF